MSNIEAPTYLSNRHFFFDWFQVCDSSMRLLAVNARYPGSVHDAAIWNVSTINVYLRRCFEEGDHESWLLGDSGYPLSPWLMTPIPDAQQDTPEWRYTKKHCRTRIVIERCFGLLKQKFRSLLHHRVLHYGHRMSGLIIYSAAVLHNICVEHNYINYEENEQIDENHVNNNIENLGKFNILFIKENQFVFFRTGQRYINCR